MKKITFLLCCGIISASFNSFAQCSLIYSTQPDGAAGIDAWVLSNYPTTNFGAGQELNAMAWTASGSPIVNRGLIRFDLSSIPANATVTQAFLSLYNNPNSSNGNPMGEHSTLSGSNAAWLQKVTTSWNELTVTWNDQPATTTEIGRTHV